MSLNTTEDPNRAWLQEEEEKGVLCLGSEERGACHCGEGQGSTVSDALRGYGGGSFLW